MNKYFNGNTMVYRFTLLFTSVVSVFDALDQVGVNLGFVMNLFKRLPLYSSGLGWVVPAVVGILLGLICKLITESSNATKLKIEEVN